MNCSSQAFICTVAVWEAVEKADSGKSIYAGKACILIMHVSIGTGSGSYKNLP